MLKSMDNLLLMQEKGEDLSKRFCHIEIKQCLVVDCIFTQIKTDIHTGLYFNT